MAYRYLGYGVSDASGVAKLDHDPNGNALTHSYTGSGAGKIDIIASTDSTISPSSLVSPQYIVYDCLFYDEATSNQTKNTNWTSSNATVTTDSGYAKITKTASGTADYQANVTMTSAFIVEFKNHLEQDANNYFRIDNSNYLSMNGIQANDDVKLIVEADKITPIINGETGTAKTVNINFTNGVKVTLRLHNASTHDWGYSNLKIYPV